MEKIAIFVCNKTSPELEKLINSSFVEGESRLIPYTIDGDITRLKWNSEPIGEQIKRGEVLVAYSNKKLVEIRGDVIFIFCHFRYGKGCNFSMQGTQF